MAYDKIVDSAKLDAAMTATAGAIRQKTGKTDKISWNADTGFKDAVENIDTGGRVTPTSITLQKSGNNTHTITAPDNEAYTEIKLLKTWFSTNAIPYDKTVTLSWVEYPPDEVQIWTEIKRDARNVKAGNGEFVIYLDVDYTGGVWHVYNITTIDKDGYLNAYNENDDISGTVAFEYNESSHEIVVTLQEGFLWFDYSVADIWFRVNYV